LKYWLLTTEYPPLYGGGISTYCYHTALMLAEKGHAITVFLPDSSVRDHEITFSSGIRVIKFNESRSGLENDLGHTARLSYAFALITMEFIRKEGKPDYIESQEYLAIPYYIFQFKLLKYIEFENVPILLTLHSPAFLYLYYNREGVYEFPNYWIGEMEKSCIQCADWIFAPSRYIVDEIKRHTLIDEKKVSVLRNPYPMPENEAQERPVQRNRIVFFGKLSPQKGVFELFSYMKELWDTGFPYPLTVIGGTEKVYYPEMMTMGQIIRQKYADEIRKGLILFTGKITPAERDNYLSDAHVILVPSLNDNLPYSAIEAMSIRKVVLASAQGGQAELIQDGENGWIFDHHIPGSFGKQLKHIIGLEDQQLHEAGSSAQRVIKENLNYNLIYDKKLAIIGQIASAAETDGIFPFVRPLEQPPPAEKTTGGSQLLSVVVPYYNMGPYIKECIDSILGSEYRPLEILVINDGSTDEQSLTLLKDIEKKPNTRVIHKKNEGLAETRNHGAHAATGEFLAFLDADDKIHPMYYSKAIAVLQAYKNVHFTGAWVQYFGGKTNIWPTWNPEPPYILTHNSVNSSALVYKRGAFLSGGLNDKKVDYGLEDYESVINLLHNGYRGVVLPECLFNYRIRKGSMYRGLTRHKILYSHQYISGKHADFYSKFAAEIFNLLNANGPSFAYDNPSFRVVTGRLNRYTKKMIDRAKTFVKKNPALKRILLQLKLKPR
jgi:glycosyltransferase involved in cell wall biosynthesis